MQIIVFKNGIFFIGKVKDLKEKLESLAKYHYTIRELIQANLH